MPSRTFQGGIATAVLRNRAIGPDDVDRVIGTLLNHAMEALRGAGMPDVVDDTSLLAMAPHIVAEHAQAFVDNLGDAASQEVENGADLLGALAVFHDANLAYGAAVDAGDDLLPARSRLLFAGMMLGMFDTFRAMVEGEVFDDAARRRNDQQLRTEGARQGGRVRAAARRPDQDKRNREIFDAYETAKRGNTGLTVRSWANTASAKKWNLKAKRLQAIIRKQVEKTGPSA